MAQRVLVDSSLIICAVDSGSQTDTDNRKRAEILLDKIISDDDKDIVVTPLIIHEVTRGIPESAAERLYIVNNMLSSFKSLEISDGIADLATQVYRAMRIKHPDISVRDYSRNFDLLHICAANFYECEFLHLESSGFTEFQRILDDLANSE